MMSFNVSIHGLEEMRSNLRNFPQAAERAYSPALVKAAARLRDMVKRGDIPVDTGRMRQSVNSRQIALLAAGVFVGVDYGVFVHEGTKHMAGRPFIRDTLEEGGQDEIDRILHEAGSSIFS